MKVAISAAGPEGEEILDSRFGRCERFVFFDTETGLRTSRNNEARNMGGAGIMAAQEVVASGSEALIAPEVGPNAFRVLSSAGVEVYRSDDGKVEELLDDLHEGKLDRTRGATVGTHHRE